MAKNDPTSKISSIDGSFNLNILLLMHTLYVLHFEKHFWICVRLDFKGWIDQSHLDFKRGLGDVKRRDDWGMLICILQPEPWFIISWHLNEWWNF